MVSLAKHNNNFGLLRLVLSSLVIVSHSSELIDGNRSRELLMQFGGTMTFGEVAVDGFFIVSGYLVLQSFQNSRSVFDYLLKRVRRIYPGFIVCAVIVTAASPLVGSSLPSWGWKSFIKAFASIAILNWPEIQGYPNLTFHALNGSAWSIPYEFRCYLMIIFLSLCGGYRFRYLVLALAATLLISNAIGWPTYIGPLAKLVGYPPLFMRMAAMFSVGGCFYVFRDALVYRWWIAAGATGILYALFPIPKIGETAFAIAGGYLIFWFAFAVRSNFLASINSQNDISYGTYLYAWPVAGGLIYFFSIRSPLLLFCMTLPLSLMAGFLSWHVVEKPFTNNRSYMPWQLFPSHGAKSRDVPPPS